MNVLILSAGTRNKVVQYFRKALEGKGSVIAADMSPLAPAYNEGLQRVIAEILNPDVPFTPQTEACKNCPYHLLCHA